MKLSMRTKESFFRRLLPVLLCLPPVLAHAGLTFTTNNGTITITGYNGYAGGYLIIPDTTNGWPVTTIGTNAFNGRPDVTNVLISTNVTSIADGAFGGCTLTDLTIPDSVTNIGRSAFGGCSLTNITVPNSVISIGTGAFAYSFYLETITVDELNPVYSSTNGVLFSKNQTTLLQFPGGKSGSYTIPDTVTSIGDKAFVYCSGLTNVVLPSGLTNIGVFAFANCDGLISIVLPNSVINIADYTFHRCTNLANVVLGSRVISIGADAFSRDYALANITIPKSVTNIVGWTFQYCTSLRGVYFAGNAPQAGPLTFYNANNVTVYYLPGTTNWSTTYGYAGRPIALWNPQPQAIGVQSNAFGFTVTGTTNIPIVVEACVDLLSASWTSLQTCTLTNGSVYFSDPDWTNHPARLYRIRSP
jgi:hypothetical protein